VIPLQAEAQALKRQDLVQPGDLVGAIEAPALLRPPRPDQATLLVEPQSPLRQPDPGSALIGLEPGLSLVLRAHRHLLNQR
jgi:hypothetical protein